MSKAAVLRALLVRASRLAASAVDDIPATTYTRISARVGRTVNSGNVSTFLRGIQNNKITTAMVLYELGGLGAELLAELRASDPDVNTMIDVLETPPVDNFVSGEFTPVENFEDEFEAISTAITHYGSLERFLRVRRALVVTDETIAYFLRIRQLSTHTR